LVLEFGRLPKDVSSWVAKLLDLNIVELRGQMTDCPDRLTTGATLIISVDVYLLPSAFHARTPSRDDDIPLQMFGEGIETHDEANLRQRKISLIKLFSVLGLKPESGANAPMDVQQDLNIEVTNKQKKAVKKVVTEIVGDGEEIEVEEGEDLSKGDLDMIYQKSAGVFLTSHYTLNFSLGPSIAIVICQCWKHLPPSL
jgi:DNA repair protein RAD5